MQPNAWWRTPSLALALIAITLSFAARALVGHPAVEDTHDMDRSQFSIDRSATRTGRRLRFPRAGDAIATAADSLAITMVMLAGVLVAIGMSGRAPTPRAVPAVLAQTFRAVSNSLRAATMPVVLWLQRGPRPFVRIIFPGLRLCPQRVRKQQPAVMAPGQKRHSPAFRIAHNGQRVEYCDPGRGASRTGRCFVRESEPQKRLAAPQLTPALSARRYAAGRPGRRHQSEESRRKGRMSP